MVLSFMVNNVVHSGSRGQNDVTGRALIGQMSVRFPAKFSLMDSCKQTARVGDDAIPGKDVWAFRKCSASLVPKRKKKNL